MERILISSCFLGERVRYNGQIKTLVNEHITQWLKDDRLIAICPEVCGGLSVPREPAEINSETKQVLTRHNSDVTSAFTKGAEQALRLCKEHNIRFALLKESSPSCGSTTIYDGSFTNNKITGEGLTTQLLRQQGIKVFSENSIATLIQLMGE